ncbi:MAG: transposase [Caldilineaceae bacterium]|nr:transposase [Caldilineaceae bacterium]
MRKQYSATYKAEIVKELLKEEKTLNQLAAETGIHPSQLKEWRKIVEQDCPRLFSGGAMVRSQSEQRAS